MYIQIIKFLLKVDQQETSNSVLRLFHNPPQYNLSPIKWGLKF